MNRPVGCTLLVVVALGVACSSGGGTGDDSPPPPPPRVTVSGTVVDETGRPYPGAWVSIGTRGATSAADGTFTVPDVATPYDAMVIAEGRKTITEFLGVTATAPVLSFERQDQGPLRTATVQGNVTDALGMRARMVKVFGPASWTSASTDDWGDYALSVPWYGDPSTTADVRAMDMDVDAIAYWPTAVQYAVRPAAVTDAGTVAGQDLTMAQLSMGRVTGTAVSDHSFYGSTFSLVARFDDGAERTLFEQTWTDQVLGAFDVLVPALPDGTVRLVYRANLWAGGVSTASVTVAAGQTGVALALPAAPVAIGPVGPSGNGNGVGFQWSMTEWSGMDSATVVCASGHVWRIFGRMRGAGVENIPSQAVYVPAHTRCDWTPGWASYTVDELVQGPAAVAALPAVRTSRGDGGYFTF